MKQEGIEKFSNKVNSILGIMFVTVTSTVLKFTFYTVAYESCIF